MAAALTRKVPGLLRSLTVCAGAPKFCLFSPIIQPPTLLQKPPAPFWASMSARSMALKLYNFKDPQFCPMGATGPHNSLSYSPVRQVHSVPNYQWNPLRNPLRDPWGSPGPAVLLRRGPLLATPGLFRQPVRSLIYFSVRKGKRKSVESVKDRFLRLHCGLWLRRQAGYKKKLWRKLPARRSRLREHVFCNKTQSKLLDKMTTSFWKRRNWYLDDPYSKYHDRVNLKV